MRTSIFNLSLGKIDNLIEGKEKQLKLVREELSGIVDLVKRGMPQRYNKSILRKN